MELWKILLIVAVVGVVVYFCLRNRDGWKRSLKRAGWKQATETLFEYPDGERILIETKVIAPDGTDMGVMRFFAVATGQYQTSNDGTTRRKWVDADTDLGADLGNTRQIWLDDGSIGKF